jgi:hypothetical protein
MSDSARASVTVTTATESDNTLTTSQLDQLAPETFWAVLSRGPFGKRRAAGGPGPGPGLAEFTVTVPLPQSI